MTFDGALPRPWPGVMERGRVTDAAFAAAYGRVPDRQRAWMKTGLAAMFAACGGPMAAYRREEAGLGHDLRFCREESPLDFALVVCGPEMLSPMRLVAAVLPALCARVPEIAVVRVGARWPHPLLTALELCGVETACRAGVRSMMELYAGLVDKGTGAVVLMDRVAPPKTALAGTIRLLQLQFSGKIGVLADADAPLDTEALVFSHPDAAFVVHDGETSCVPPFVAASSDLDATGSFGYDAVCGDVSRLTAAFPTVPLVLGPGRETFWLWPTLPVTAFCRQRLMASVDHRACASG